MKNISKLFISTILIIPLFVTTAYANAYEEVELIESEVENYYPVSKVIEGDVVSYTYDTKNIDQITREFEKELNEKEKNSRNASSGYTELQLASKQRKSTGNKKIANQPSGGVSFSNGGQIYYKDGSSFSVPLSISVAGKVFGFNVGIGSFSRSPTTYGINIPKGGRYHAYVNKTYDLYVYKQYRVSPNGQNKVFEKYVQRSILNNISFEVRKL
ncbi:MAG: hypothetical protein ACRDAU_05515 [Clostridium sp.]